MSDAQAERERLIGEIRAAEEALGIPDFAYPTPDQYVDLWDALSREARLVLAESTVEASTRAMSCFIGNHLARLEQWEIAPLLHIPTPVKGLRETLCVAQTAVGALPLHPDGVRSHTARLQALINECDRHRPLGPDGTHGDLHTPTCGCEDR